jgi:hypothetical protein
MRVELIPVLFGIIVGLAGLLLVADARLPDRSMHVSERRRRVRAERSRGGELLVGAGLLCMSAALIGRDHWRYGALVVIAGTLMLLVGAVMNFQYLRELFSFRGAARRLPEGEGPPAGAPERPKGRHRIR